MKILIIPSLFITDFKSRYFQLIKSFLRTNIMERKFKSLAELNSHFISAEHYNYSNIVNLNGKNNTYILGNYFQEYILKSVPKYSRYPSSHATPLGNHINLKQALSILSELDCILIGIKSFSYFSDLLKIARSKNILISVIDYYDDKEIYNLENLSDERLTRNLTYKKDFDVFFKHDIPINEEKDYLYSICPMPINFENYPKLNIKSFQDRSFNVFFSGRKHLADHPERVNLLEYLFKNLDNFKLKAMQPHEKISLHEYCEYMNDSKIAFSPSGKVWDSTRHSECAIYKNIPLIKEPNCKLANGLKINESNSIIYKLNKISNNFSEILEKVKFFLNNENESIKISENWHHEMITKNTLIERSRYIYKTLIKHLNAQNI